MVRNVPSMQSLHNSMSELDLAASSPPHRLNTSDATSQTVPPPPPSHTKPAPTSEIQQPGLVNLNQPTQLVANDDSTKSLMNQIATGQATREENARWEKFVAAWKAMQSSKTQPTPSQPAPSSMPPPLPMPAPTHEPLSVVDTSRLLNNAEQSQTPTHAKTAAPSSRVDGKNDGPGSAVHDMKNSRAWHDYEMQLMLLEQQNKKRLLLARQAAEVAGPSAPSFPSCESASCQICDCCKKVSSTQPAALFTQPESKSHMQTSAEPSPPTPYRFGPIPPPPPAAASVAPPPPMSGFVPPPPPAPMSSFGPPPPPRYGFGPPPPPPPTFVPPPFHASQAVQPIPSWLQQKVHKHVTFKDNASAAQGPTVQPVLPHQLPRGPAAPFVTTDKVEEAASKAQTPALKQATRQNAAKYAAPFCKFLTENPTVFHAVAAIEKQLSEAGFAELSEREQWRLEPGKSYFVDRNGSSVIAFTVGGRYDPGNGAAILAGHVDALTAKLKPISQVPNKAGYIQLGIAPYAGAPNNTWWDRDLSVGGRVLVKEGGKIVTKLVKLDYPIARIPTLAPHFGAPANGPFNAETQMVPIIGLEDTTSSATSLQTNEPFSNPPLIGQGTDYGATFVSTQPPSLVKAIGDALGLRTDTYSSIVNWELELFDIQPATVGGLDKSFIFAGRIDDKLCSWAAVQALIESKPFTDDSSIIQVAALFDDEEIGSLLRQGARGNFLPQTLERAVTSLADITGDNSTDRDLMGRTYANSFLVSSDVTHAVNPNFLNVYLENHSPHLNTGVVVSADSNGHMTTDAVSTAILTRCADKVGAKLQVFQIRNDSRSGGTVGPMLSAATGIRAIDAGIPQLSMHSIRATTGSLDPGLGVICFMGFLNGFEEVDQEFR